MTTTTQILPDGTPCISLRDPAQIIASVPPLLGFRPENSVVVLGLGGADGTRVRPVVRLDIPAAMHEPDAVRALQQVFDENPVKAALIVLIGHRPGQSPPSEGPPHRRFVESLCAKLGPRVPYAVWAAEIREGARWCAYHSEESGVLPDDTSTVTAAVFTAGGKVTFESREELAAQLAPDDVEAVARRAKLVTAAVNALDPSVSPERLLSAQLALVRSALERVRRGHLSFSDGEIVGLALALSNTGVRDACLALARVPHVSSDAERLWLELVRRMPAPERSEAAVLLSYFAYLRGEGALAGIAADNALDANPRNVLADLLSCCLVTGLPPERLHGLACTEDPDLLCPESAGSEK
ncbi:DUF4192 domain-containing protein [Amycolatopsis alkalitolerans]|uniref:DUF4192 domain-containing protein n=1 Tax=Amycolatopsis alkalitolerans TaxID=2547244 RepID=UPI0013575EDB|nr:DUF4192 domain-containing protein [Amycolatopsis alkalitolerans]